MSIEYWSQYSGLELMSLHGIEVRYDCVKEEAEDANTCDEIDKHEDECHNCTGRGCNLCLMLSW